MNAACHLGCLIYYGFCFWQCWTALKVQIHLDRSTNGVPVRYILGLNSLLACYWVVRVDDFTTGPLVRTNTEPLINYRTVNRWSWNYTGLCSYFLPFSMIRAYCIHQYRIESVLKSVWSQKTQKGYYHFLFVSLDISTTPYSRTCCLCFPIWSIVILQDR